jgi:hypothetical protein
MSSIRMPPLPDWHWPDHWLGLLLLLRWLGLWLLLRWLQAGTTALSSPAMKNKFHPAARIL